MTNSLEDEILCVIASMDNDEQISQEQQAQGATEQETEPAETIHIHYFPDAIVILKEDENIAQVVEGMPVIPQKISFMPAYAICSFYLFLIFSCIAFQVYEILNPPIARVTIVPKAQTVTLSGTLQLGRFLNPITISQSQTTPATGKGHQDAKAATGFITFYNGELQSVTIPAGKALTGISGVTVITDQDVVLPAANINPPTFGQITVSAHAINPGRSGTIAAFDVNNPCCFASVIAKNSENFTGGQDERNFQTVAKSDIDTTATSLKTTVRQSMQGALQGQVQQPEQLYILPCTPNVTSDHPIGAEAAQIKVTVSEICSAVAYNYDTLIAKATNLLSRQAFQHLGTGYSLFGIVKVSIIQATVTHTIPTIIFSCLGTWVYAISQQTQQSIKKQIAGKPIQTALKLLLSLPGVERASIEGDENTKLPKNISGIHFHIIVQGN